MTTKKDRKPRARWTGSVQQRGPNSFRIRYYVPGLDKQVSETVRGTRKEAEAVLRERQLAAQNGGYVPKTDETVSGFMQRWLDTYAATNTMPRTQQGYRGNISRYINPAIGSVVLQELRPQQIQKMYSGMTERGLSARTVMHTHRVLREALNHAVKWGMMNRNVADATTPPRPKNKEIETWNIAIISNFLEYGSKQTDFHDVYCVAIHTGMRRSELCGLRWDSVDLDSSRIMVTKTLQRITGKGLTEGQPKTDKSRRAIALNPTTVSTLRRVRTAQLERKLSLGPAWIDTGYIFTELDGRPIDADRLSKDFARTVRKAGLPHLTLHGLRHAHATLLLSAGVHPKIVSERLGHSNISITLDIYSHVLPDMQEEAALAIEERLVNQA